MFQEIDLADGIFLIGRSPSCNLTLEDPLVSRNHARITVSSERVTIADLGSRNGTLVNDEPLFDDHLLDHNDKIRIGSHEIVFLEERRQVARPLRTTAAIVSCPTCRSTIATGTPTCPHCGGRLPVVTRCCPRCRTLAAGGDAHCTRCGMALEDGEDTITLHMGGGSSGWTTGMVSAVIEKAMRARRFDHAARLLAGKIEDYEVKSSRGVHDVALLAEIVPVNAALAAELKDGRRLRWIVDAYARAGEVASELVLGKLLESARGWYNIEEDLARYLQALESLAPNGSEERLALDRLRKLVRN
jgi:hypothetical protein